MSKLDGLRLTQMTKTSGCAAKIGPGPLSKVLGQLPKFENENLLVGVETSDDAAVYKVTDDIAMIQTLDFFTPVVDDPYTFGQVAATNALSDIYAMGGEPKVALNIVAFPNCLDIEILGEILKGGADKVAEAGAVLVGGHSIQDDEPKYGLSVSGFVHPDKILKNCGAKPGDALIITKQIGVGLINSAVKGGIAEQSQMDEAVRVMTSLNRRSAEIIKKYPVNSCTDVTGFGLLGHSVEMAEGSGVTFDINVDSIAFVEGAREYAEMGLVPAGTYKNKEFSIEKVDTGAFEDVYLDLLYDPQTSGGLLISVPEQYADSIMADLEQVNNTTPSRIGSVREFEKNFIKLH